RYTMADKYILISYKRNNGTATTTCNTTSGGVTRAPTISKIKYAYFLIFLKNCGVTIPKLVRNITIIGISNNIANGSTTLNINLKYLYTVNNSLNIPSFNESKKDSNRRINTKKPKTRQKTHH